MRVVGEGCAVAVGRGRLACECKFDAQSRCGGRVRHWVRTVAGGHGGTRSGKLAGQCVPRVTFALRPRRRRRRVDNVRDRETRATERTGCAGRLAEVPDGGAPTEAGQRALRVLGRGRATRTRVQRRRETVVGGGARERQRQQQWLRAVLMAPTQVVPYKRRYRLRRSRCTANA